MKILVRLLIFVLALAVSALLYLGYRGPARSASPPPQKRPDLVAMFTTGNVQQWIDHFGTVSRSAFDASGKRIGTQVGHVGAPRGIVVVEMTYLVPDADHPLGQAFDGDGNPTPLHTGPDNPMPATAKPTPTSTEQGPLVS